MKEAILYVHGKGGSVAESEHYKTLFPECEVVGVDYQTFTPWETGAEIRAAVEAMKAEDKTALALYRSVGFEEYGRNPKGFRSRVSGWQELVLMRLEL